ncbi:MAG TPA: trypsin-like peptidase domain-containing protein [Candidatus Acidoferrales bacterium]|nr:trypsin-like peptidase domain-containing protein [Candidatus Acidoferrales bacterium]
MSTRLTAADDVLKTHFLALRDLRDIATLLQVRPQLLGYYLHRKDNYKRFQIAKRCGGTRDIFVPVSPIKIIQSKLNQVLTAVYGGRSVVHGFARGKSIVSNARRHLNSSWVLNFDLRDFFPSLHFGRIKGLFESKPYSLPESVAVTLAQICCHDGFLPAGAPTSPIVSNLVCGRFDAALKRLASDHGCRYSRYADDITFSLSHGNFPPQIVYRDSTTSRWILGDPLNAVVSGNGFRINESKTRVLPRGYRQEVTGLVVNHRINVKRRFIRRVRAMLHAAEKWGVERAESAFRSEFDSKQRFKSSPSFLHVLRGRIEFVGSVRGRDDGIYLSFIKRYCKLDPKSRTRRVILSARAQHEVIERAIWVLEHEDGTQGTAFAAENFGFITAAHALKAGTLASCPALAVRDLDFDEVARDKDVDVARFEVRGHPGIQLRLGTSAGLKVRDPIRVFGFPLYRVGNRAQMVEAAIAGTAVWHGVPHFIVDCPIVRGSSGGPILDLDNKIVGIAVHGQGIPWQTHEDDELSRFVPIDFALKYLKAAVAVP